MSRAWGRAASAIGDGILQMGQQNQREKLEAQRQANMERLRQENIGIRNEERDHRVTVRNENRTYQEGIASDNQKNANEQNRLKLASDERRSNSGKGDRELNMAYKAFEDASDRIKANHKTRVRLDLDPDRVWGKGEKKKALQAYSDEITRDKAALNRLAANFPSLDKIHGATIPGETKKVAGLLEIPVLNGSETKDPKKDKVKDVVKDEKSEQRSLLDGLGVDVKKTAGDKVGDFFGGIRDSVNKHAEERKAKSIKTVSESRLRVYGGKLKKGESLTEQEWIELAQVNPYDLRSFGLSKRNLEIIQKIQQIKKKG